MLSGAAEYTLFNSVILSGGEREMWLPERLIEPQSKDLRCIEAERGCRVRVHRGKTAGRPCLKHVQHVSAVIRKK
jgi:hypothetical protein